MSHHEEHDHEHDDAGSEETIDPIQHFWGTTVQPESEYTVSLERSGASRAMARGAERAGSCAPTAPTAPEQRFSTKRAAARAQFRRKRLT